jgi:hypothetical protein
MIGFISTSVTVSLSYSQYSTIADLHTFQFTVAHTLGFSVFNSNLPATDLNTETSTSDYYEVILPFLVQSPCNLGTQLKSLLDSSQVPFPYSLISSRHRPHRKQVSRVRLRVHWSVTSTGRDADDIENTASSITHPSNGLLTKNLSSRKLVYQPVA